MTIITLKVLLAAFILVGGIVKVIPASFQVEHWSHYRYPLWFLTLTGCIEIIGALTMVAGIWSRYAAIGAGLLFVILMLGAMHAHLFRARQHAFMITPAFLCLIISIIIIVVELKFSL